MADIVKEVRAIVDDVETFDRESKYWSAQIPVRRSELAILRRLLNRALVSSDMAHVLRARDRINKLGTP